MVVVVVGVGVGSSSSSSGRVSGRGNESRPICCMVVGNGSSSSSGSGSSGSTGGSSTVSGNSSVSGSSKEQSNVRFTAQYVVVVAGVAMCVGVRVRVPSALKNSFVVVVVAV